MLKTNLSEWRDTHTNESELLVPKPKRVSWWSYGCLKHDIVPNKAHGFYISLFFFFLKPQVEKKLQADGFPICHTNGEKKNM